VERLKERLRLARRALATLLEVLREPRTPIVRDASIKRFEYTYETVWKAAQAYLAIVENLDMASPTAVARACFRAAILTEDEARDVLHMAQDRNLTVHTYDESLADEMCSRLPEHARLMGIWLESIQRRL
jgi:nucleotidyltransferase substrate binding protein (TIGR01987 family)